MKTGNGRRAKRFGLRRSSAAFVADRDEHEAGLGSESFRVEPEAWRGSRT